jgi:hypothetical protein
MMALGLMAAVVWAGGAWAGEVRLVEKGQAQCVIVAPAGWTNNAVLPKELPQPAATRLQERGALYRESVKDLALYLGKMSGAKIEIVEGLPAGDKRIPIYIGTEAQKVFGDVGKTKARLFAFRVVAGKKGVGLYGESEVGTSYAIYELLYRLGCRWFMPTDLGEAIPELPTLTVPETDEALAPATKVRGVWQGGADYMRRNRLVAYGHEHGGDIVWLAAGDGTFQRFFSDEDIKAHPDWSHEGYLRLVHPEVADHIAKKILEQLATAYEPLKKAGFRPGYSIVPSDGQVPTEDPMARKCDPEPRVWEPAAGRWSVTDRCMLLHNRIADKVRAKYPDVAFGDQAYVNKSLPPARYPVPKDFHVTICPIDFNRHHPMTYTNTPNHDWLLNMVQGWGKAGASLQTYWYLINLAELSAPCPFITKLGTDIPILMENHLESWCPETMNGWDSMLPGYVLASRLTFYPQETPDAILQDLWTKFYGAAAEPMARYWTGIDRAYIEAHEFSGSPYGYLKIFTPEVMKAARAALNEALKTRCTDKEARRVKLIDESFGLFERYMKMRNDWADGKLANLEADYEVWRSGITNMQHRYQAGGQMAHVQGRHGNPLWSDSTYSVGYKGGAQMEKDYARHGVPMLEWKWKYNPGPEADSLPWTAPGFSDTNWPVTHVVRDTWSSLGHHLTMTDAASGRSGRMAYRASQKLPALPAGKKVFLWIGATDGSAKLFVNGRHAKYVTPGKGEIKEAFGGYCQNSGTGFDVTGALKTGENQFTILAERTNLNELGTGGIMGPVVLYREK